MCNPIRQFYKRINSTIDSFIIFYRIFLRPKKIWRFPDQCEILLYDSGNAKLLQNILPEYKFGFVSVRGEFVNVPCLIRAMLKKKFWVKGQTINIYASVIASKSRAKLILTWIDNNSQFYTLWKLVPFAQTMFIQYGYRDDILDKFTALKQSDFRVHYMLVHNNQMRTLYASMINGRLETVGSLVNNYVKKTPMENRRSLAYISQYREKKGFSEFITETGASVSWSQFFEADRLVFAYVTKWCEKNNFKLIIIGATSKKSSADEQQFYNDLSMQQFEFLARDSDLESYAHLDKSAVSVAIDSTLAQESLARGNRTAIFHCRNGENQIRHPFGWPGILPEFGPFWTSSRSEEEFERVMNSVAFATDEEWEVMREPYLYDLMIWDSGNTKAKTLIKSILNESKLSDDARA